MQGALLFAAWQAGVLILRVHTHGISIVNPLSLTLRTQVEYRGTELFYCVHNAEHFPFHPAYNTNIHYPANKE